MTISGRPVTTSHAGSTTIARIGVIVGSLTSRAPMKIASQPLRVTATRMPTRLADTAIASGTCGSSAFTNSPIATPANTDGKIRPPRKPDVPAIDDGEQLDARQEREAGRRVVADRRGQLLHLVEALEQRDRPPDDAEQAEQEAAEDQDHHRRSQALEQGVRGLERVDRHHPRRGAAGRDERPRDEVDELRLHVGHDREDEGLAAQQVHGQRAGRGRDQRPEQAVPAAVARTRSSTR